MRYVTGLLLTALLVAGAGWAWYFLPYHIDAWRMQEVAGAAVLTWESFSEEKGRNELANRMRSHEVPDYIPEAACSFYEEGSDKVVDCQWQVDVYLPVGPARRLSFSVVKVVGPDGRLADY